MRFPGVGDVPILWYFVEDDAPNLPFPTVYNSLNWDRQGERDTSQAGEVRGAPRPWYNGRKPQVACDLVKGSAAAWDGVRSPLVECCPPEEMHGGIEVGRKFFHYFGDFFDGQGGIELGGAGTFGTGWPGSGGLLLNGRGTFGTGWPGSGGLLLNGAGTFGTGWPGSGGLLLNGAGTFGDWFNGDGGLLLDGSGDFSVGGMEDMPVGAICFWGNAIPPVNWFVCDGQAINRTTYAALFAIIGTTFGAGNGTTTFNIPDMRSRFPIGDGTGSGLSAYALAATGGEETHVLTTAEIAAHTHAQNANTVLTGGVAAIWNAGLTPNLSSGGTTGSTGGGGGHNNIPPYLALVPIIRAL